MPDTATISELYADPGRWDGKQVKVTGQVEDRAAVLGFGGFRLSDGNSRDIAVVGTATPAGIGQTTTVTGKFVTAFVVGDVTVPVIVATMK